MPASSLPMSDLTCRPTTGASRLAQAASLLLRLRPAAACSRAAAAPTCTTWPPTPQPPLIDRPTAGIFSGVEAAAASAAVRAARSAAAARQAAPRHQARPRRVAPAAAAPPRPLRQPTTPPPSQGRSATRAPPTTSTPDTRPDAATPTGTVTLRGAEAPLVGVHARWCTPPAAPSSASAWPRSTSATTAEITAGSRTITIAAMVRL
mmetsp:Transcript_16800/g.41366  ORF Transcript_16800/g.41366 Transcript_16800/m.41366 type:complete len:206 (-) Transcript_16800:1451-2068(-)